MKKEFELILRYVFLVLITFIFLSELFVNVLIEIFTYITFLFAKIFEDVVIIGGNLFFSNLNLTVLVTKECIAPAAYILISFIFLSMPIRRKLLFKVWIKSILLFSLFNLIRIFVLIIILIYSNLETFEDVHALFYNFLSGIGGALIVLYYLKKENLKYIFPVASDIKYVWKKYFSKNNT